MAGSIHTGIQETGVGNMKTVGTLVVAVAALVLTAGSAVAQDPVRQLQDLRNSSVGRVGYEMQQRGYTWLKDETAGVDKWDYWRENRTGRCVSVHSSNAQVHDLTYAPAFDCGDEAAVQQPAHGMEHDYGDEFQTVCGVMVQGRTYRYLCDVKDYFNGRHKVATDLRFPDQLLRLTWRSGNQVTLNFEGMTPQYARYATHEGETNFQFEDKTYFYYSDRNMARWEVENFRP